MIIKGLKEWVADKIFSEEISDLAEGYALGDFGLDDIGTRRLSRLDPSKEKHQSIIKGLTPVHHDTMLKVSYFLYMVNPVGRRIPEINKDFVIGEGMEVGSENPDVKKIIDSHWNDRTNNWPLKQHSRALETGLYGEQCWPAFVNRQNGHTRLGYIDPLNIKKVHTNPYNCEDQWFVELKPMAGEPIGPLYKIIREDDDPKSRTFGRLIGVKREKQLDGSWEVAETATVIDEATGRRSDPIPFSGECFYFAINRVTNQPRGTSDLMQVADWLDGYDQYLWNIIERSSILSSIIWDVTIKNPRKGEVKRTKDKYQKFPIRSGGTRVHGDRLTIKPVVPELGASENTETAKLIKEHWATGTGMPEHWLATGGDVNFATAKAMGHPVIRRLSTRQLFFKTMVEYVLDFQIDQALIAGWPISDVHSDDRIHDSNALNYKVTMDDVTEKDDEADVKVLKDLVVTLTQAETQGYASGEASGKVFREKAADLGYDLNDAEQLVDQEAEQVRQTGLSDPKVQELMQDEEVMESYQRYLDELREGIQ